MYRSAHGGPSTTAGALSTGARTQAQGVPILMYHSVATRAAPRFARFVVRPADFAGQMDHLAAEGYQPLSAADLVRRRAAGELPARPVVLTFDDAFTDFETVVMPILQKHGFPATLYVRPRTWAAPPPGFVTATRTGGLSSRGARLETLSRRASKCLRIATPTRSSTAWRFHWSRTRYGGRARRWRISLACRLRASRTRSGTGIGTFAPPWPPRGTPTRARWASSRPQLQRTR